MDSDLSSVEEFEDSVALPGSSDEGAVSDKDKIVEDEEELDDFLEEDEDEYQEYEDEEEDYMPEVKKKPAVKVAKPKKPKRQTATKKSKAPAPSRQSSRVRKHVDYDQTIDDEEFFEDLMQAEPETEEQADEEEDMDQALDEEEEVEEKPAPTKKKKQKIELIEDDLDDSQDLGDSVGFGSGDDGISDDAAGTAAGKPKLSSAASEQRRSQMLENLIGLQSRRHGNAKEFTDEEMQLKKAESARRRKNFIEKRMEEEKQDVLNKLLKRRAPKAKPGKPNGKTADVKETDSETTYKKPRRQYFSAGMTRTIINKSGITYSLP